MLCAPNSDCRHARIVSSGTLLTLGAATGLMLGMLFARRSGKELRKDLSKAGEKQGIHGALGVLGSEIQEVAKDAVSTGKEVVGSDTVKDVVAKGKGALRSVQEKGQELAKKVEQKLTKSSE